MLSKSHHHNSSICVVTRHTVPPLTWGARYCIVIADTENDPNLRNPKLKKVSRVRHVPVLKLFLLPIHMVLCIVVRHHIYVRLLYSTYSTKR